MQMQGKALCVTIYIGEENRYQGRPLYTALLEFLRREGAMGATVTRGLAGFGARSRIHAANLVDLSSDLPIKLEWIDHPEQVDRLMPLIRAMIGDRPIHIQVDGGVTPDTAPMVARAGADVLVAGSAVFTGGSVGNPAPYGANIRAIRTAAELATAQAA